MNSQAVWLICAAVVSFCVWIVFPADAIAVQSESCRTVYFLDSTADGYITEDDADMFVYSNAGDGVRMKETIDTESGKTLWYAQISEAATDLTFCRASCYHDEHHAFSTQWGTWEAGEPVTSVYSAIENGRGSWVGDTTIAAPAGSMEDFWYGIWIDTRGDGNAADAVKWHQNGSEYHLYVPSYADLTRIRVYSSFDSFIMDGIPYANGDAMDLAAGAHTLTGLTADGEKHCGILRVYQTHGTAAMFMITDKELFTGLADDCGKESAWPENSGLGNHNYIQAYKDAIETSGWLRLYNEQGENVYSALKIKKIKGRGNSSFEGAIRLYGKYSYNINLDKEADLTGNGNRAKKWCLLANNTDITMMRNAFVYALADDAGIRYAPETRLVDLYDNGKYLGAYVITERIEQGPNTLMDDMKSLDDGNQSANMLAYNDRDAMDELEKHFVQKTAVYVTNGMEYRYQYTTTDDPNGRRYYHPDNYKTYNYLLEFELQNRYQDEPCWFESPRTGQAVVVKCPEYATKDEMKWIISCYEKAEAAVYHNDTEAIEALIDVDSFAKMYLIQELAINLDSGATSYYIHNDLNSGKLAASPVWDYDWALGVYAGNRKYTYNGSSVELSRNMSDPEQMFAKVKALQTEVGEAAVEDYNFQAKLVQNDLVWKRCQYYWTNVFVPILAQYVDNDCMDEQQLKDDGIAEGKILTQWLPQFRPSMRMNDARWNSVAYMGDYWGTKVTSDYNRRSFDFEVGVADRSGTAEKSYDNAVYYLNDWIAERWNYMSSEDGGGLYNKSLTGEAVH